MNVIPGKGIRIPSRPRPSTLRLRQFRQKILYLKHRHGVQLALLLWERVQGDKAAFLREFMSDVLGVMGKVFADEVLDDGLTASIGQGSGDAERMGDL